MTPEFEWKGLGTMSLAALLGGAARQAHQWLSGKTVTWRHFIFRAIISIFIGVICFHAMPKDAPWTYAACGLFSWLGADGIALLVQLCLKKTNDKDT